MSLVFREGSLLWMMEKVEKRVEELVKFFVDNHKGKRAYSVAQMPDVIFAKRGRTAGTCHFNYNDASCLLNFNRVLMKDNWDDFDQTVIHEVAHYCTYIVHGVVKPHGIEWKRMMQFFGVRAKRCHSYDTTSVRITRKTFIYTCNCSEHVVSSIRHNRVVKYGARYVCKKCRTVLEKKS